MSLPPPQCYLRRCRHFSGLKDRLNDDGSPVVHVTEAFVPYCPAFPDGIPTAIAFGRNRHLTRHRRQVGISSSKRLTRAAIGSGHDPGTIRRWRCPRRDRNVRICSGKLEAPPGFDPGMEVLQI